MADFAQYRVSLLDWTGSKIGTLFPGDDFLTFTWQHARNAPGPYRCELVAETATKDRFLKHYQILVERNVTGASEDWYEEYIGFHLAAHEWWTSDNDVDEHYWASMGFSPEWLLTQPLLQPMANTANPNWTYYDIWANHGPLDDVLKSMVNESLVNPLYTERAFNHVGIAGDTSQGNWGCYEGQWIPLYDAMLESNGEDGTKGNTDFHVVRTAGGYEFRTYSPIYGTDRRRNNTLNNKPVVFSFEQGNLRNPDLLHTWAEAVTVAYGGWQGAGMEQAIYSLTNATALAETPYARREAYYNLQDINSPDSVLPELAQKLIDDGAQLTLTATIQQTPACLYGRDWSFGDLATVDLGGASYDVRIIEVNGSLNADDEERIEGAIELWTRD